MLLDGTEGHHMFDNITINRRGQIFLQEDPGVPAVAPDYLAVIWRYTIETGVLEPVARHDPERFLLGSAGFLTRDEESSGIIDVSDILGEGWFLLDVQAPYNIGDLELVAGGQLLAMHVPPGRPPIPFVSGNHTATVALTIYEERVCPYATPLMPWRSRRAARLSENGCNRALWPQRSRCSENVGLPMKTSAAIFRLASRCGSVPDAEGTAPGIPYAGSLMKAGSRSRS